MAEYFKASELLEFAIQIEKNGEIFYRAAAKKSGSDKVRNMFLYLAEEEVKHRNTYKALLKSTEDYQPPEIYPGEYFRYLQAYADQHIFVNKEVIEKKAEMTKSDIEAIDLAMGFEKDSILYYLEMIDHVPENEKNIIDRIVKEEHSHYLKLTELEKGIKNERNLS